MLLGVAVGVGELLVLGTKTLQVIVAAAVFMLAMAALLYSTLPLIQAGSSAVLIIALQSPESGGERMLDPWSASPCSRARFFSPRARSRCSSVRDGKRWSPLERTAQGKDLGIPDPRVALVVEGIRPAASDVAKLAMLEGATPEPSA